MPKNLSQSVPYEPAAVIPEEELVAKQASGWSTRVVLIATVIMLAGLVLLCMIGPHLPGGE